jgi:hypothetical protein
MKTLIGIIKALRLYFVRHSASYKRKKEIMKKIYEGDMKTRYGNY